jgi:RNAse (barnase) inhibitor barstar
MLNALVEVDLAAISDTRSFHATFAAALGFPAFYGANMDAWTDCMTCLDDPSAEMTSVHVAEGRVLTLQLKHAEPFKKRCPDLHEAMVECTAFVNWRRIERGLEPVLCLSYSA